MRVSEVFEHHLRERVVQTDSATRFILARESDAVALYAPQRTTRAGRPRGTQRALRGTSSPDIGGPVYLTQRDVREIQLAKGAMAAGMAVLMKEMDVGPKDIEEVLLAGAFGNFIRRSQAMRIGLLPNMPTERIRFVGNAAGAGARMALMSSRARDEAEKISLRTQYVELAGRPDFQQAFADAMLFPEP